jgi:hypothetical protein
MAAEAAQAIDAMKLSGYEGLLTFEAEPFGLPQRCGPKVNRP